MMAAVDIIGHDALRKLEAAGYEVIDRADLFRLTGIRGRAHTVVEAFDWRWTPMTQNQHWAVEELRKSLVEKHERGRVGGRPRAQGLGQDA